MLILVFVVKDHVMNLNKNISFYPCIGIVANIKNMDNAIKTSSLNISLKYVDDTNFKNTLTKTKTNYVVIMHSIPLKEIFGQLIPTHIYI